MMATVHKNKKGAVSVAALFPPRMVQVLAILIAVFPFCIGGYHVFASCLLTIALGVALYLCIRRNGQLSIYRNDAFVSIAVLLAGYLLSALWAVDCGMAALGFVHLLPLLPMSLLLMQCTPQDKTRILRAVPFSGAVMTVLSYGLHFVPAFKGFFTVSGRLAGFFQYPNTFALFLLIGIILCLFDEVVPFVWKFALTAVLLFGIFESGSRTIFALTAITLLAVCVLHQEKRIKLSVAALFVLGVAAAGIYVWKTQDMQSIGRFLTTSLTESTFLGRLLYYKDALPVILRHPFGLGYMGYYYTHHTFQTGVYQLMFVHNGWLQFLLDMGWLPTIYFAVAVVQTLLSKSVCRAHKLVVSMIVLHSMADFDFEYVSILLLLLICMDFTKGKQRQLRTEKDAAVAMAATTLLCVYFGTAQFLQFLHLNEAACRMYPPFTTAKQEMLSSETDLTQAEALADSLLQSNGEIAECYRVKAGAAYARGEIAEFIQFGLEALEKEPYNTDYYETFGNLTLTAIRQYESIGDIQSARMCAQALQQMQTLLEKTKHKTSDLAWKIQDQPDFTLSDDLTEYIKQFNG